MTTDDKIRAGMIALTGASLVLATMGLHVGPIGVNANAGFGGS